MSWAAGFLRATLNDVAQRVATGNKHQQRRAITDRVRGMGFPAGGRVLDFGCGTGLFARPFTRLGLDYVGYDVDPALVGYARHLRRTSVWVSSLAAAAALGPFDLILANCCFHHIPDQELRQSVLPAIAGMMRSTSVFLLIDVLPPEPGASGLRRAHARLEQGGVRREVDQLERLVIERFAIRKRTTEQWHMLSLAASWNPVYTYVVAYDLVLPD